MLLLVKQMSIASDLNMSCLPCLDGQKSHQVAFAHYLLEVLKFAEMETTLIGQTCTCKRWRSKRF